LWTAPCSERPTHCPTETPGVADAVVMGDSAINRLHADVRRLVFEMLRTPTSVAEVLREVLAELYISIELERIADHAVSIAKEAKTIAELPPIDPAVDIEKLAGYCREQLREALGAVVARDAARAQSLTLKDDRIDRIYYRVFDDLIERMHANQRNIIPAVALISVAHHLERVGDRVTNIAEALVFLEDGQIVALG